MKYDNYIKPFMLGAIIGVVGASLVLITYELYSASKPTPCTCYYRTTDDRFREGYTKANKPCLSIEGGHVKIGDTVYLNITEYRNECP